MKVPYAKSVHGKPEIDAVVCVLKGNTALGAYTHAFEDKIAKLFGKKYGIMVNSGSSANLLAVEFMDLPKGSEVITPLLTFATVVAPLVQKGLIPVFVDVEPGTYLINIDQVERAITKKTRALFIPSLLGNVPDLHRLRRIANKHNLILVEDSCDTLGATLGKKPTGIHSHITTTSFYGSHIINGAGGGGMVMVNDRVWRDRAIVFRGWGRSSSLFGEKKESEDIRKRFNVSLGNITYDTKFIFGEMGYNFLPLEVSAAFALEQLKRLKDFSRLRNDHYARLRKFFTGYEHCFTLPETTPDVRTNWLAFPLTIKKGTPFTRRDITTHLEKNGIQTRPIFTGNILMHPGFKNIPHKKAEKAYPVTEHIMKNAFLVGCHQGLTDKELAYMEKTFQAFLRRYE
ncbi:MAG: NarL family transcriptional regulator [Candidatus Ryanbacteria bacterium CG10_big_fil_rev_8_21_14_0_10_43_42]|uniref:NarL family transcriptional regulator n=1 Tax=Candidatus Ryanbacteria bacterium CG10_big_fil_rev_8_21_14_0_10_43_42 TaxID=1974864 RepID=A0A2M8KXF6_9BACT|nr:MAG: NarL family transcriptional regulator [Candidatus Ryanbacteria bacterium CG10_big_fil_rev_8_21_14_0_10_43_42]